MGSKIAKIVSYVFEGSVLAIPTFLIICFYRQDDLRRSIINLSVAILFGVIIPYLLVLILYKTGKIKDLHLPRRKDRFLPVCSSIACFIAAYFIIDKLGAINLLKDIFLLYIIALLFFGIITLFWKISFHSSYITLFSMICILIFGKIALLSILLIALVSWARLRLKRHTPAQVVAGIGLNMSITFAVLYFRGYLSSLDPLRETYTLLETLLGIFSNLYILIGLIIFILVYSKRHVIFSNRSLNVYGSTYR